MLESAAMEHVEEKLCPRADLDWVDGPVCFYVDQDPAIQAVAGMVVAGVDKRYKLHPLYNEYSSSLGRRNARKLIESQVSIPGATDLIQTDMELGGMGLFGGLELDGKKFTFYEWGGEEGQLYTHITIEEARAIVEGRQKGIAFYLVHPEED